MEGEPPRPPGLPMQIQQIPAQPSMAVQQGSLGAFYHHLRGGTFSQQQLLHHQHQQAQQQQQQQQQQRQQTSSRNSLFPSTIHSPAPVRHNPNSSPTLNQSVYPSETSSHIIPHPLTTTSSPPSSIGVGVGVNIGIALSRSDPVKRKRGRPRKYTADANGIPLPPGSTSPSMKKAGKGSAKKTQLSTYGAMAQGFTPHVLTVNGGEDITAKIMSFSQHGPWAVCILSANGAISTVSLRHAGFSSTPVTYEGHFEVLSLSGLFLMSESGGSQSRVGGLSVSLAGSDGGVIGGNVAGLLMATSPVQVILGTFFPGNHKFQAQPGSVEDKPLGTETKQQCLPNIENDASGSKPDQTSNCAGVVDKEHTCHIMPLPSADWGGSHLDLETSGHSEQI